MNNGGVQLNKYTTQAQKGTTMQKPLIYVAGPYRDPRCCDRRDNHIPDGQQPRVGRNWVLKQPPRYKIVTG